MFDEATVTRGFEMLTRFAQSRGLGAPVKVMWAEVAPWADWDGVACEWIKDGEPIRLSLENFTVGEGNTLYVRSIEITELVKPN